MISRQRYKAILGACSLGLVVALLGAAPESAIGARTAAPNART